MRDEEYFAIKERAAAVLRKHPDVTAVGLGGRERNGQPTGEIVIKVFVRDKKPASDVPPDQLIPASFEGVGTDVVEMGAAVPRLAPVPGAHHATQMTGEQTHTNPVQGGMILARLPIPPNPLGSAGTLGCIVRDTDDGTAVYALTNRHVIDDDEGRMSQSRPILRIMKNFEPAFDLAHPLGYGLAGTQDSTIDAAVVRLDAGFEWSPKIKEIGFVTGIYDVDLGDSVTMHYQVRKRGERTGLTGGILIAVGVERVGMLSDSYKKFDFIIRPNAPAAPHQADQAFFAHSGDSGSVVVNDDNEVIGLLWGSEDPRPGISALLAVVTPIGFVLEHFQKKFGLNLEVATAIDPNPTDATELQVVPPPAGAPLVSPTEVLAKRDGSHHRPLVGGSQIVAEPFGFANSGTLGCIVTKGGDEGTAYMLTSYAALSAGGLRPPTTDTDIGQPDNSDSCSLCCRNTVGEFTKGGPDLTTPTAALVKLESDQRWMAEILQVGLVDHMESVTAAEINSRTHQVRKRGPGTRLTGGVVWAVGGVAGVLPPGVRSDAMIIRPNVDPLKPPQDRCFSHPIDRGAVVVDAANFVVGLLYDEVDIVENGITIKHGVATPMKAVIDALNALPDIEVEVATTTNPDVIHTTAHRVAAVPEASVPPMIAARPRRDASQGFSIDASTVSRAFTRLQEELLQSNAGRLAVTAWREHRGEIRYLIDHNRKVATVWHRSGGPALLQAFIRALQTPLTTIPSSINGVPTTQCVDRLAATFCRHGSPALQAAVTQVRGLLPSLGGLSLAEILAELGMSADWMQPVIGAASRN